MTTIHRVGQLEDEPFIVMEWLEGRTLDEILEQRGRLPVREALELTVVLLEALESAHRAGIVHRDVKPANLLLLDDGRLKVTDFGIALLKGRELIKTQAGVVLATPRFAAPEQLRGAAVDGRADLFSCGVVLYLMLTGKYPFSGDTFMELATAILGDEPIPPRVHRPDLPERLEALLLQTLQKDPGRRPASATRLAESLKDVLHGAPGEVDPTRPVPLPGNDSVTESGVSVLRDLPEDPLAVVSAIVAAWDGERLPHQEVAPLLRRLLEKPLHTTPFAGVLEVSGVRLLIGDGRLVHATTEDGESGDAAAARLPEAGHPLLRKAPEEGWIRVLTTLLNAPAYHHRDLDSSFVDLPALADKLRRDQFDGIVRLDHLVDDTGTTARAWIPLVRGRTLAALYSKGWRDVALDQSWRRWVEDHPVRASVLETVSPPLDTWYPIALESLRLDIARHEESAEPSSSGTGSGLRRLFSSGQLSRSDWATLDLSVQAIAPSHDDLPYRSAPTFRILRWLLGELPAWLRDRRLDARWKYLSEWIPLVRRARLHHPLRRPGSEETDRFDVVTFDESGKVLHVVERATAVDPGSLRAFIERVKVAKTARLGTGDIGAAVLVAPSFYQKTLEAYESTLESASSGRWISFGETLTGYEGFVRIGPRRGFHLLLVTETPEHKLEPLVPTRA